MYALPYADGQFDTVSLGRVLTGAQRPWDVIGEAARVLRPDGALLIVDLLPDGMPVDAWCQSLGDWLAAAGIEGTAPHRLVLPGCTGILHRGRATAARVTAA
jgi:ArsR family transcriptional regulator